MFYVYVYLDPRKFGQYLFKINKSFTFNYEPFYVGKGKGGRKNWHLQAALYRIKNARDHNNPLLIYKLWKIWEEGFENPFIYTIENLSEAKAFKVEEILIKTIGRKDLKTGTLANLTDGGEGMSNQIKTYKECKEISKRQFANWKKSSYRRKISEGCKRAWQRPGYKEWKSKRHSNRISKNWIVIPPDKLSIWLVRGLHRFCKVNDLHTRGMHAVAGSNTTRHHKGWFCFRTRIFLSLIDCNKNIFSKVKVWRVGSKIKYNKDLYKKPRLNESINIPIIDISIPSTR